MAYEIDGVSYSYDYEELIDELVNDLYEGLITESTLLDIVRDEKGIIEGKYHPIIDYYYPDYWKELNRPLGQLFYRDEFTVDEWRELEREREKNIARYKKDTQNMEKASVSAVLTEMEAWNTIV